MITGLINQYEETTCFVAEGHNVPLEAFEEQAREDGYDIDDELSAVLPPRNVYAIWKPMEEPVGAFSDDTVIFTECTPETEGAKPYSLAWVAEFVPYEAPAEKDPEVTR